MSRTTLGPDSVDGLADHGRSGGFGKIGLGPHTLDEDIELVIRKGRQRAVDLLEARPRAEKDGQDFLRERLPVVFWQGTDLFRKGPYL